MTRKKNAPLTAHVHHEPVSMKTAMRHFGVGEVTLLALIERGDVKVERDEDGNVVGVFV